MTNQEFYAEANEIVELHKAYGNIIDWDKDERPVQWPEIAVPPKLYPPASSARDHYLLMQEMGELPAGTILSEMA